MTNVDLIATQLLKNLHENKTVTYIQKMTSLLEILEEKEDPKQKEILLAMNINETLEKLNNLENHLKQFVTNKNKFLIGNKLDQLYKDTENPLEL